GAIAYQGVSGSSRAFVEGETIFVTWYNNGSSTAKFTPKISFDDPDGVDSGTAGTWHDMELVVVGPGQSATTSYTLPTGGNFSRVNVARSVNNLSSIVCDRIDIGSLEDLSMGGMLLQSFAGG